MLESLNPEWLLVGSGLFVLLIIVFFFLFRKPKPSKKFEVLDKTNLSSTQVEAAPGPQPTVQATEPWIARLRKGLGKTRQNFSRGLDDLFSSAYAKSSREELCEKIFEILITSDVGYDTATALVDRIKEKSAAADFASTEKIRELLKTEILNIFQSGGVANVNLFSDKSSLKVVMMVGVNGVGKTTTTGKLAFKAFQNGLQVAIGAADTFRAAAVEQLSVWAERSQARFIRLKEGADPASVAFETVKQAQLSQSHLCLIDTAGRLHNRNDLMQELSKIKRSAAKELPGAPHEVLLVLDATTGQNALQQAKVFRDVVQVTGLVLTKLDGTAKGGVALAIANELKIPIYFIGVGEQVEDLEVFRPNEFVDALFDQSL